MFHYNMILTFKGIKPKSRYDKLKPKAVCERIGDYVIRDYIRGKWEAASEDEDYHHCSNLAHHFILSDNKGEGILANHEEIAIRTFEKSFPLCISSPLLKYPCACTFPEYVKIADEYRMIWRCFLKSKSANSHVLLSEWKGTPHLRLDSSFHSIADVPDELLEDIVELLNYLLSDQYVHPFDNTVAGTHS